MGTWTRADVAVLMAIELAFGALLSTCAGARAVRLDEHVPRTR
jgi:hypothetical protein